MKVYNKILFRVTMVTLLGCGCDAPPTSFAPVNLFQNGGGTRFPVAADLDTLWSFASAHSSGGSALGGADQIVLFPNGDAAVLDIVGQQVHRIGPTGILWSWGRRGEGPGEVQNIRAITLNTRGEVVVADSGRQKLVWLSSAGQWLRETGLPPVAGQWGSGTIRDIAALDDGKYVLTRSSSQPWLVMSAVGEVAGAPVPWRGFAAMHPLQTYGHVAAWSSGKWLFGFSLGNGFFVFSNSTTLGSYPYVEHVDFPAVVSSRLPSGALRLSYPARPARASQDIAVAGDTLFVLAHNWILDRYMLTTGKYIGTLVLPAPARGVAIADGAYLFIDADGVLPSVTAYQKTER